MNVLCVVAHPDDESLFAGAALAQHALQGDRVAVVSMGTGVGARGGSPEELLRESERRTLAFLAACDALGVPDRELFCAFPDQRADTVPQIEINRAVASVIDRYQPTLVYTHHAGDLNVDHRRVAEAVLVGTRMGPVVRCMTPEFPDRCVGRSFKPNTRMLCQLNAHEAKIKACLCYESELRAWPHPRSERAIRERGEVFMEIR